MAGVAGRLPPANQGWGTSTAGTEFIGEVRNLETTDIVSPTRERIGSTDAPELRGSIFGQQEVSLSRRWKADLGLRYDRFRLHGGALPPRAALLFRESPATVWKLCGDAHFATQHRRSIGPLIAGR
jgi:outer membrane receptor protein involved in Fe transport